MIACEIQLWFAIRDKIQYETKFSPRQNSVREKIQEKNLSRICIGLTVTKVSCLGQINAYHQ